MIDDATLLSRYARDRSEEAFAELVQRHLPLVYSAAVRRTDGDVHRAKDVAQIVFTALARDAAALSRHAALTGWLYAATRNAAIDLMRAERRRRLREEKAHTMENISSSPDTSADWEQLRPVLDAAMDELDGPDREAVLLRFFESQPFSRVAAALRVNEDAARKRVDRALDKLGALLARRGITSTSGALAVLLANQTTIAAPAGVAASITSAALAGAGALAGGAGAAGIFIMSTSKTVAGISAVVAAIAIGSVVYQTNVSRQTAASTISLREERDALQARLGAMEVRVQQADARMVASERTLRELQSAAPQPAAGASSVRPASGSAMMDHVLDHPETHAPFVEQQVLRSKVRFARFVKAAGLSQAQQEDFFRQIRDRGAAELDFMLALRAQGYGVGNLPQDPTVREGFQKLATEQRTKFESGLRAVLGEEGYKAYQQFGATMGERNVVDELNSRLHLAETPLSAEQVERLTQTLVQNRFNGQPTPTPGSTLNGTLLTRQAFLGAMGQATQQNGMTTLDWHAPVTDGAISAAVPLLTPVQLAALRQVQAQQLAQFQLAPPPPANSPGAIKAAGGK